MTVPRVMVWSGATDAMALEGAVTPPPRAQSAIFEWVPCAQWAQAYFTKGEQKFSQVVPVSQRKRQLKSVPPAAGTERSREMRTKGRDEIPS